MNQVLLEQLIQLIAQQTGLVIRPQERVTLEKKIQARIKSLNLSGINAYYSLLNRAITSTSEDSYPATKSQGETEWKVLTSMITNGESFFFRDDGQFKLLREQLLPQLIVDRRKSNDLRLKIWSAGCSTGEEPYSIAMLLKELIPDLEQWQISILGTDINQQSLIKARQGIYQNWSFRRITSYFQTKYFRSLSQGWELKPEIRRMITFQFYNLTQDNFLGNALIPSDFDLILCRNVFIYLERGGVQQAVNKFYSSLRNGGFFISGHAELQEIDVSQFLILSSPESVYYQRDEDGTQKQTQTFNSPLPISSSTDSNIAHPNTLDKVIPSSKIIGAQQIYQVDKETVPVFSSQSTHQNNWLANTELIDDVLGEQNLALGTWEQEKRKDNSSSHPQHPAPLSSNKGRKKDLVKSELKMIDLEAIELLIPQGKYAESIQQAQELIKLQPNYYQAYYLMAQACANQGNLSQATECCDRALAIDSSFTPPLYLLAQIAEEQNQLDRAKELLKKIIYLEPDSIPAYLELGSLYNREGNLSRAKKMYDAGYKLLQKLALETEIEYQGKVTVSKLINYIKGLGF